MAQSSYFTADQELFKLSKSYVKMIHESQLEDCVLGLAQSHDYFIPIFTLNMDPYYMEGLRLPKVLPQWDWKFRYLDFQKNELIEIALRFHIGFLRHRDFSILLDPSAKNVQFILNEMIETKKFGLLFYCALSNLIVVSFVKIDTEEHLDWLKRNLERAKALKKNDMDLMYSVRNEMASPHEELFVGNKASARFTGASLRKNLMTLQEIKQILWNDAGAVPDEDTD